MLIFTPLFSSGASSFQLLRVVRIFRLVRLFVVMNKVQKAQRAYKKAKYLKLGSPVERVMELLGEMKNRIEGDESEDVRRSTSPARAAGARPVGRAPLVAVQMGRCA